MRLDAHQHFWRYDPGEYTWMTNKMGAIKQDFLPRDLLPLLEASRFDGCVAVQARQSLTETEWLLDLAKENSFIKAVVGWVDLQSDDLRTQLSKYTRGTRLAGVRHVVHDEPDDLFMTRPQFRRGIAQLKDFGLTYDLL